MTDRDDGSGLVFPVQSHRSTDDVFTWGEVKAIMDKEIMRRAEYVTRVVEAMRERFGEEALEVAAQAIYQIGFRKGQARSIQVQDQGKQNDLESLSEMVAHKMARLYLGTTADMKLGELTVRETYCPLPVYWKSMGMSDTETVRYCKIFDQVDKGMVEGYNPSLTADLGGAEELARLGYCQMVVRERSPQDAAPNSGSE
jgi:hypothetical protein